MRDGCNQSRCFFLFGNVLLTFYSLTSICLAEEPPRVRGRPECEQRSRSSHINFNVTDVLFIASFGYSEIAAGFVSSSSSAELNGGNTPTSCSVSTAFAPCPLVLSPDRLIFDVEIAILTSNEAYLSCG